MSTDQHRTVLKLLADAGPAGVSAYELVYVHGITRGAAVVYDLRRDGYEIETINEGKLPDNGQSLARYVLKGWRDPDHGPQAPLEPVHVVENRRPVAPPPDPPMVITPLPVGEAMDAWRALGDRFRAATNETPEQREERVRKALGGGR